MANRSFLWMFALLVVSPVNKLDSGSPELPREAADAANPGTAIPSGIRADRLSERQLNIWRSIQGIVFAKDASGRFKHPNLQALWQQADESGYPIYVEFRKQPFRWASAVGDFHVEKADPGGQGHAAVIRLYLSVIDRVQVDGRVQRTREFVPFLGLRKTERYAEVLGHELAHAVWILANPDLRNLCERPVNADVKTTDCHRQACDSHLSYIEMRDRLIKLESLMGGLEMRARAAESVIWRELRAGRGKASAF